MNDFEGKILIDGKQLPPESAETIEGQWVITTTSEREKFSGKNLMSYFEHEGELTEMFRSKLFMKSLLKLVYQ